MSLDTALAYWSGLAFVASDLDHGTLVGTTIAMNICNAFMCRVMAGKNGRSKAAWFLLGFVAGIWAVAVLVTLPRAVVEPSPQPELP